MKFKKQKNVTKIVVRIYIMGLKMSVPRDLMEVDVGRRRGELKGKADDCK